MGRENPQVRQWYLPMLAPQQGQLFTSLRPSPVNGEGAEDKALGISPTTSL
jgi:hypothetical protein